MRLSVTLLGLDLFTLDLTTGAEATGAPDFLSVQNVTGFCLPERDGGTPENVD